MCNSIPSLSNSNPLKGSGSGTPDPVGNSGSRSVGGNSSGVTGAEAAARAASRNMTVSSQSVHTVALGETIVGKILGREVNELTITVANKLTDNLAKTASNFFNTDIQGKITSQFKEQIEGLKGVVNQLEKAMIDAAVAKDDTKMLAINAAITEINGFVSRFNNNGVGGIRKAMFTQPALKSLQMVSEGQAEKYNIAKKVVDILNEKEKRGEQLNSKEKLDKNAAENAMKRALAESKSDANLNIDNLVTLKVNLIKLGAFAKNISGESNGSDGEKLERMLHLLQETALSAWIFNDINGALEDGFKLKFPGMDEMLALNTAARNTPMFVEESLSKLGISKQEDKGPEDPVNKFITKFNFTKLGYRGRSGAEPTTQERVKTFPIANLKEEIESVRVATDIFSEDPDMKAALKGGFVPSMTANLKTVPDAMVKELNGLLTNEDKDIQTRAEEIANKLKDAGLVDFDENATGDKVTAKDSFAGLIDKAGLPTYCSVSGTTGELVSVLYHKLGGAKGPLQPIFSNLLKIANSEDLNPVNFDFSTYFAPIATFMEIGHFHTAAEVLGGFYSVAVAQQDMSNGTKTNLDTMQKGFEKLLSHFIAHPERFLGE